MHLQDLEIVEMLFFMEEIIRQFLYDFLQLLATFLLVKKSE